MSTKSVLSTLAVLAVLLARPIPSSASEEEAKEKTGAIACDAPNVGAFIHHNTSPDLQPVQLEYTVNCSGNWSLVVEDSGGGIVRPTQCPVVINGGSGACSVTLSAQEKVLLQGEVGTGAGARWTFKHTP